MNNKYVFLFGIIGVSLFAVSSIVGGVLIENYSLASQYISETYAIDTEYGTMLRTLGFIPSGILITVFCILGYKYFPESRLTKIGFYGLGIFYGVTTVIVGFFPCDSGCNRLFIDPSISQMIHNFAGLLTYLLVPFSIILIGLGLKKSADYIKLSQQGIICGITSILFVFVFFSNSNSEYSGLLQRIVEIIFISWIILCALVIKYKPSQELNT